MIFTRLAHRVFAVAMIATFGLTSLVQARPMPSNVFVQQDEKKKLPPVNWVRSRTIDVKHLDIDLRFDWDKEQAIGTVVITFAPFADTDRFTLDAGAMTIDSVSPADGGFLKLFVTNDRLCHFMSKWHNMPRLTIWRRMAGQK